MGQNDALLESLISLLGELSGKPEIPAPCPECGSFMEYQTARFALADDGGRVWGIRLPVCLECLS